ncbi:hypothetical protein Tco_0760663 [Tanacetum coccineum]
MDISRRKIFTFPVVDKKFNSFSARALVKMSLVDIRVVGISSEALPIHSPLILIEVEIDCHYALIENVEHSIDSTLDFIESKA